jgi:uncharacterized membrane protein
MNELGKLTVEPAIGSATVVACVLLAVGILGWWLARGMRSGLSSPTESSGLNQRAWKLTVLRLLALGLLALALLRPAYIRTDRVPTAATVVVLLDGSRSMTLSADGKQSRWEVQRQTWNQLAPSFAKLGDQIDLQVIRYAEEAVPLSQEELEPWLKQEPKGNSTDVAGALAATLRDSSGRPLAAVILLGDGTQTATSEGPASVSTARSLGALNVPLWTVPIGPRVSAGQSRDLSLQDLADQFKVFTKNRFEITATLLARGFAGKSLPIKLDLVNAAGKRTTLQTRQLKPDQGDQSLPIRLDLIAPEPGSYRMELIAEVQEGEVLSDNNLIASFVDVREGGGRVLYLEGQPSYEQIYVRRAINESDDLQLSYAWKEWPTKGEKGPTDLREELQNDRYDVFVIGDLPAPAIGDPQLRKIAEHVQKGKALLMTGGFQSFDNGGYGNTILKEVLPVRLDPVTAPNLTKYELSGSIRPLIKSPHPIVQLSQEGDNQGVWRGLPPMNGASKLGPPKQAPGVLVLLEDDRKQPLLVVGEYGRGRVAALGLDSTWQWWTKGRKSEHRRFWRQLMLWLLARDDRRANTIWVELDRRRWPMDQKMDFRAGLDRQQAGTPIPLIAEVLPIQGVPIPVSLTQGLTGDSQTVMGRLSGLEPGFYQLRISTAAPDIVPAQLAFQVTAADRELNRPTPDIAQLEQLADLTRGAGGRAFEPAEIDELIEKIGNLEQQAAVPVVARYRLGDGPLSGSVLLALLLGVLSTEWWLRKKWQLP